MGIIKAVKMTYSWFFLCQRSTEVSVAHEIITVATIIMPNTGDMYCIESIVTFSDSEIEEIKKKWIIK